jgi:hypothetical protein
LVFGRGTARRCAAGSERWNDTLQAGEEWGAGRRGALVKSAQFRIGRVGGGRGKGLNSTTGSPLSGEGKGDRAVWLATGGNRRGAGGRGRRGSRTVRRRRGVAVGSPNSAVSARRCAVAGVSWESEGGRRCVHNVQTLCGLSGSRGNKKRVDNTRSGEGVRPLDRVCLDGRTFNPLNLILLSHSQPS